MSIRKCCAGIVLLLIASIAAANPAQEASPESQNTYVDSPGQWIRLYGVRYVAPFTFGHDDSALTVNGDRFEIEWDDRPLAERLSSNEPTEAPVFAYVGERLLAVRDSFGTIPAESLMTIVAEANSLLAARQSSPIDLALDGELRYANVLVNGRPVGVHIGIAAFEVVSRSEVVRRMYEGLAEELRDGVSVIWGEDYHQAFSPSRATGVDSALTAWGESVKAVGAVPTIDRPLVVNGVALPCGVLPDIGRKVLEK